MYHQNLSDAQILEGFRKGNASIIREYFYGYCRTGYYYYDQQYQLQEKENLDFMSLAHQYFLYLIEHDWKPLEDHSPAVKLRTWFINGFRYIVLDALKWYKKEYGTLTYEDYLKSFDITSDMRMQFNKMVEDLCWSVPMDRTDRLLIDMILLKGFKAKDIADQLGLTPSAISQRYKKLREQLIMPYLKQHFDMDLDMPEVMDDRALVYGELALKKESYPSPSRKRHSSLSFMLDKPFIEDMEQKRTTPEFITELLPGEIFVFGSNLKGMHGGGAAYIAYRRFGAILGQGVGLQGQSYAIPTMQGGVETIRPYVDEFIAFAKEHEELTFLVTRIGCGIAGFDDEDIAPLFTAAHEVDNIVLPPRW